MEPQPLPELPEVVLFNLPRWDDPRGWFREIYHAREYTESGINCLFLQTNHSWSTQGVLRGLHYQNPRPQAKLVYVASGEILDVAVDIRRGSPTFGKAVWFRLSEEGPQQAWIPAGFAHGFYVFSPAAHVIYLCSDFYFPEYQGGVRWNDPELGIPWPSQDPLLSDKDRNHPRLGEIPYSSLPEPPPESRVLRAL